MIHLLNDKTCVVCAADCADRPRVKDPAGRYYCRTCYESAKRAAGHQERPFGSSDELGGMSPVDPAAAADRAERHHDGCPNCRSHMPDDAVICTQCGYNLQAQVPIKTEVGPVKYAASLPRPPGWPITVGLVTLAVGAWKIVEAASQFTDSIISSVIGLAVACWAAWAGFGLIRRRPAAAGWLHVWSFAVIGGWIFLCVGLAWYSAGGSERKEELIQSIGDPAITDWEDVVNGFALEMAVNMIWPLFLLVWLFLPRVRKEINHW